MFKRSATKPKPEYTKWYRQDYLLAGFTMVSCTAVSAFLVQEWLKNVLVIIGISGEFWFLLIFFTRKLYRKGRNNPGWLTCLQSGIRIVFVIMIVIAFIALALTDREHIRDVLYH